MWQFVVHKCSGYFRLTVFWNFSQTSALSRYRSVYSQVQCFVCSIMLPSHSNSLSLAQTQLLRISWGLLALWNTCLNKSIFQQTSIHLIFWGSCNASVYSTPGTRDPSRYINKQFKRIEKQNFVLKKKSKWLSNVLTTGADAIKKFTPSLGIHSLGVGNHLSLLSLDP